MPRKLASFITVLISIIILTAAIVLILTYLGNQLSQSLNELNKDYIVNFIADAKYSEFVSKNLEPAILRVGEYALNLVSSTLSYLPGLILNIFIVFFTTYYLLIDWENLKEKIIKIIPFENKRAIVEKVEKTSREILISTLIVALLEAFAAIIGLWLLGVKLYIILGILIGIFALIPGVGPVLIWVPIALIFLVTGKYYLALGTIILGIILSFVIDHWLRIKIMGKRVDMHPIIMLFGLLGGVKVFGLAGFIIGPIILSILVTIIENIPTKK
jgi:predicted PurR-regulated permease PerM